MIPAIDSTIGGTLRRLLSHKLTRGLDLDDPRTTALRVQVIRSKPFLHRIYSDWYRMIQSSIPSGTGRVVEIGAGAGYFKQVAPDAIASEVFFCPGVDVVADARRLPFRSDSLKAIVMTDVFHHIPDAENFLNEAARCLRPGGRILMIEPWVGKWSTLIYKHLHHEPFLPEAQSWMMPEAGPLSTANGALPWIVFVRDRRIVHDKFPQFTIEEISPMMPFLYLISGGISLKAFAPASTYRLWQSLEAAVARWNNDLAMFAFFSLRRQ